ncbi:cyclic pyranopterin monophosphate synthase MoaC [Alicyclobacillaceae bacterium I2511]|nr:cyclic pyranopterin monophosphate synthase MoaC [Alicyclobacillaceae bacterium I2511]
MKTDLGLTHFDEEGRVQMVDISSKQETLREAIATAVVRMAQTTKRHIQAGEMKKGDVLTVAEIAGVMAAKRTADLIPLCHPLPLASLRIRCEWVQDAANGDAQLQITATIGTTYRTGVEMEAMTACSVSALTVYDMCKAVDRGMSVEHIHLLHKSGGKSGVYDAPSTENGASTKHSPD